jgi:hypothetical protein
VRRVCRTHSYPAASLSHRFARSPVDMLSDLVGGGRWRCQIPIWLGRNTLTDMRIAAIPQRWPARRGYVWWLRVGTAVVQNPSDLRALGNECDQAHLSIAQRARQPKFTIS